MNHIRQGDNCQIKKASSRLRICSWGLYCVVYRCLYLIGKKLLPLERLYFEGKSSDNYWGNLAFVGSLAELSLLILGDII